MLDDQLKELKKNAQKLIISLVVGNAMNRKTQANKEKTEQSSETELANVKSDMTSISANIGNSVKGQFGTQVKESLENQNKKLGDF